MTLDRLTGLIAAPFTPFHADGSLWLDRVELLAQTLQAENVSGAFVCGTTGEGLSLTIEERMKVAERWVTVAPPGLRVIVHVGHSSLADCQALAAHAQQVGASAIGIMAPHFFRPKQVADLVNYCASVAQAAPALPFYYYHIPSMTGVSLPCVEFLQQAADRIPTLAGIKFTHEDLMDYLACLQEADGRFDVLFGRDEMLLAALALGAKGAIGSTYNYAANAFHPVIAAFQQGDLAAARRRQRRVNGFIACMIRHGGLAAGKAIMAMKGRGVGPVRPPLRSLTAEQAAALERDLELSGFFDD